MKRNRRSIGRDDSAVSPVIGTILIVALAVSVATAGATLSTGAVDLPGASPQGNHRIIDAPGEMSFGSQDGLVVMEHQGGDRVNVSELGAMARSMDGSELASTYDDTLVLRERGDGDGWLETGESLLVSEAIDEVEGDEGDDEDEEDIDDSEDGIDQDGDGRDGEDEPGRERGELGAGPQEIEIMVFHVPSGRALEETTVNVR